ncbi:MAG: ABC transporter ATP-binding protein, partial [Candidatus Atribacteria bacterium]|nr:ABC transporter ATP-binding protein [Candidatus Atribacteria bacterium]
MGALLCVQDLWVAYGAVDALRGVTIELKKGDIVAVLGANGAG